MGIMSQQKSILNGETESKAECSVAERQSKVFEE